jgi:lipopolysaccharide export LptBFGC system permease protein LptF
MIDLAINVMISVVLGGLVLAGLYLLFGSTILPMLSEKIKEIFNYQG